MSEHINTDSTREQTTSATPDESRDAAAAHAPTDAPTDATDDATTDASTPHAPLPAPEAPIAPAPAPAVASEAPIAPSPAESATAPASDAPASDGPVAEPPADTEAPAEAAATDEPAAAPAPELDEAAKAAAAVEAKRVKAHQARVATLYRAARSGRPVEGAVEKVIKGGYEIRVNGVRAFCPHSQIDVQRVDDAERHVGQSYPFRVIQIRRGGDDVIVSRRALVEAEVREQQTAVRATLVEGRVLQGRVVGVAEFGAFVDLGAGVTGLVHISELSHSRVRRVRDAVAKGDLVPVTILSIDNEKNRISLSIRQAQADPWAGVAERFPVGSVHPGTVERLADFGAFVKLADGVEALAPASEFPPASGGWQDGLDRGAERRWAVLSADEKERRISITQVEEGVEAVDLAPPEPGAEIQGRVQRTAKFGVFVWLGPGRVGLMPAPWTGTPRGAELDRAFPIGEPVEVTVVDVEQDGRKIRVARKGVDASAERSAPRPARRERREPRGDSRGERRGPKQGSTQVGEGTFGTSLADKLRAVLGDGGSS